MQNRTTSWIMGAQDTMIWLLIQVKSINFEDLKENIVGSQLRFLFLKYSFLIMSYWIIQIQVKIMEFVFHLVVAFQDFQMKENLQEK